MLIERYNEVKKHVEEACKRVGRDPREVTVIAVSKTKPLEMVEELRKEVENHPAYELFKVELDNAEKIIKAKYPTIKVEDVTYVKRKK